MGDSRERENGNEATGDARNDGFARQQERCSVNQYQLTESHSSRKLRGSSRSRSRSVSRRRKQWRSANAFLNFMQDFRQRNNKLKNKDLFRLGGQVWRQMSAADKMPYVKAAKSAAQEQQSQQQQQQQQQQTDTSGGQQNKSANDDSPKKSENQRKDQKRKEERRRSSSKTDISDTESDSTSETGASMTSENDASDLSS